MRAENLVLVFCPKIGEWKLLINLINDIDRLTVKLYQASKELGYDHKSIQNKYRFEASCLHGTLAFMNSADEDKNSLEQWAKETSERGKRNQDNFVR